MEILIVLLILSLFLGLLPAFIAKSKGRSFVVWYVYGVLLFLVAVIHSIVIKSNENAKGMRKCPSCASIISQDASICPACRTQFSTTHTQLERTTVKPEVREKLYSGERDINSPAYQLYLTKKYAIEKNATLEKFTIDESVFDTLLSALEEANSRYDNELIVLREHEELVHQQSVLKSEKREIEEKQRAERLAQEGIERLESERVLSSIRATRQKEILLFVLLIAIIIFVFIGYSKYSDNKKNQLIINMYASGQLYDFAVGSVSLDEVEKRVGREEIYESKISHDAGSRRVAGFKVNHNKSKQIRSLVGFDGVQSISLYYCVSASAKRDVSDRNTYGSFLLTGFSINFGDYSANAKILKMLLDRNAVDKSAVDANYKRGIELNEDGISLIVIDTSRNKRDQNVDVCGNG